MRAQKFTKEILVAPEGLGGSLMANLDFFGTPKMTVTKFQNRLRSFGAETRAEVSARRNSSKYVTRLKSILTSYKICAAKHFTVSAWK